jgi:hypothetical protein
MKAIRVELLPSRSVFLVWSLAGALSAGGFAGTGWLGWRYLQEKSRLLGERAAHARELEQLRQAAMLPPDPRKESLARASRVLRFDLNRVFSPAESSVEGAHLVELSWDADSRKATVQFLVESVSRVGEISEGLNVRRQLWVLQSLTDKWDPAIGNASAALRLSPKPAQIRATWVGDFDDGS